MQSETKSSNLATDQKPKRPKLRMIGVKITTFQHDQIDHLVALGIARSPTDFLRMGMINLLREYKDLLPDTLKPPAFKKGFYKKRQRIPTVDIDRETLIILKDKKNPTDEEIYKARQTAQARLLKKAKRE